MSSSSPIQVCIIGGGIAGIVAAIELLDAGHQVTLLDRDKESELGGLAKWAFGGMFFVDTKHQRRNGIKDSIDLAKKDWFSYAQFEDSNTWGKKWAIEYIETCTEKAYHWLRKQGLDFFSVINWAERGMNQDGNSVPRFHMVWGTGFELVKVLKNKLLNHKYKNNLRLLFQHRVQDLLIEDHKVIGCKGLNENTLSTFEILAEKIIVATGGINGSIVKVKAHWDKKLGAPPENILNGAHKYAVGDLHESVEQNNGHVINLEKQWNYAMGIKHYKPRKPNHGLSVVPCKSALWLDASGKRIGPTPLVTGYDTRFMVEEITKQKHKYSWQLLNRKIALKELAVSGSEHNDAIREKKYFRFILNVIFGNKKLLNKLVDNCEDIVMAKDLKTLCTKMNAFDNPVQVEYQNIKSAVDSYDKKIDEGEPYSDLQHRLILNARKWRGDKARTCNLQKIGTKSAGPYIAIRSFILSRKSLGGIQTNLDCEVLMKPEENGNQKTIKNLYAIGEAAGFGGGGIHGYRSLEGTFLGACVVTARKCAASINGN